MAYTENVRLVGSKKVAMKIIIDSDLKATGAPTNLQIGYFFFRVFALVLLSQNWLSLDNRRFTE